jgi:hypothetical protein
MNAFSYGIGIYLGQEVWYGVMYARYRSRKLKAQEQFLTSEHSTITAAPESSGNNDDWDREYHAPQNIHGNGPFSRDKYNSSSTSDSIDFFSSGSINDVNKGNGNTTNDNEPFCSRQVELELADNNHNFNPDDPSNTVFFECDNEIGGGDSESASTVLHVMRTSGPS